MSSEIHAAVRGLGPPVRFILTGGQRGDVTQARALIDGLAAEYVLADTAYDADHFRDDIKSKKVQAVIPSNHSRPKKLLLDKHIYKAPSRGMLLQPAQAVPKGRNTLRNDRRILPWHDHRRGHRPLAPTNVPSS